MGPVLPAHSTQMDALILPTSTQVKRFIYLFLIIYTVLIKYLSNYFAGANNFKQPATVPLASETHGGDDVGIFAIGPQAHMFQGVYEQNYIAHVMAYAACIGPGLKFCDAKA